MIDNIINIINQNSQLISLIMLVLGLVMSVFAYTMAEAYKPNNQIIATIAISIMFYGFGVYLSYNDPNPNSFTTKYNQYYIVDDNRLISTYDNKDVTLPNDLNDDFIKHINDVKKDTPIIHTHYDDVKKTYTILYSDYEKQTISLSDIVTTEKEKDMNEAKKAFDKQE